MHHPRSNTAALSYRLAAMLLLANCVLVLVAVILLGYATTTSSRELLIAGTVLAVAAALLVVVQWIAASRTGCPLCRTQVLAPKRCSKHRKAKTLLGSHRLRVAIAVVFKNQFRCPYCNESTGLEVRETLRSARGLEQSQDEGRRRI